MSSKIKYYNMNYQDNGVYLNDLLNKERHERNDIISKYNNDKRSYSNPIIKQNITEVCIFCNDVKYHYFDQTHDRYCSVCHSRIK